MLDLRLKAKFYDLRTVTLALEVWPWPKYCRTSKFTFNFRLYSRSTFFTYLQWAPVMLLIVHVRVLEKTGFHYFIFYRKPLHYGTALIVFGLGQLALSVLALLTKLRGVRDVLLPC